MLSSILKAIRIVLHRLRTQGLRTTLLWLYGRGLPKLTGVPMLRFSEVTPQIAVGPQYGRRGKRHLQAQGYTAGVNLRTEFDDAAHGLDLEAYCHLPTVDDDAIALEHLEQGVAFIREAVERGGKVYIHCAGGVGRAPTMAAAYFIDQGMALDDALALIRRARPFINIMSPQMARLREFEALRRSQPEPAF